MKFLVGIILLGTCLNLALAKGPETLDLSNESSSPNFANLVKSTIDLLGPEEAEAGAEDQVNQSLKQSLSVFATLSSEQQADQSCE